MEVIGIGVAVRDVAVRLDEFPRPNRKYRTRELHEIGGGPVPTALVTLSRLGRRAGFVGIVGADAAGQMIVDGLEREGVTTRHVVRREGFASPVSVILVEHGRRTILEHAQYDLPLAREEVERSGVAFEDCRALLIDARLVEVQLAAARRVRAHGGRVVLDCGHPRPGVEELLPLTDVAIFSYSYPESIHGSDYDVEAFLTATARQLPEDGPQIAGLTLGERGCAIYTPRDGLNRIPGHRVEAVDSTGAGDVFHGAFAHAMLDGDTPVAAARFANVAAALSCRGMTGRAPLPDAAEIRRLARSV
jgi:ribokinase